MQDNSNQEEELKNQKKIDSPFPSYSTKNKEILNINNSLENPLFENIFIQIKQELIVEGYSLKTIKMYLIYIKDFFHFTKKEIKDLTKNDIISFLAYKKEEGCNNATLSLIHASLKYLFKKNKVLFLLEEIKIPKKSKTLPKVLTRDEIKIIFNNTRFGRNRLMLQFMYGSGCRVSEVTKIKVDDLNLKEKTAMIKGGKGDKDRIIILSKEWIHGIKKYLNKKKIKSEFVFSKKNGKPLTTDTIQRIVREASKRAGLTKHVTPHCFRHSYATHLLETGTNIRYIQTLLGHSNLNTTQIYTNVANQQLKKVQSPLDKL
ncbi:MAG: tyrosine-type recombinase/integrase [Candidatus ainarchaeum sp.]|jgi:integrase/recombinase XerD|nr:tyrosine-type recombinase/integrase [Candidatus ainarchaeum sp.]MDD4128553.1 tyrosine-type recombinase/integrase [Candidatus ainarchaeum sp.]